MSASERQLDAFARSICRIDCRLVVGLPIKQAPPESYARVWHPTFPCQGNWRKRSRRSLIFAAGHSMVAARCRCNSGWLSNSSAEITRYFPYETLRLKLPFADSFFNVPPITSNLGSPDPHLVRTVPPELTHYVFQAVGSHPRSAVTGNVE